MQAAHRRHDISDKVWAKLEPLLPGQRGMGGGIARDNRLFINAVCWIFRTGIPLASTARCILEFSPLLS
jgi:transposase